MLVDKSVLNSMQREVVAALEIATGKGEALCVLTSRRAGKDFLIDWLGINSGMNINKYKNSRRYSGTSSLAKNLTTICNELPSVEELKGNSLKGMTNLLIIGTPTNREQVNMLRSLYHTITLPYYPNTEDLKLSLSPEHYDGEITLKAWD